MKNTLTEAQEHAAGMEIIRQLGLKMTNGRIYMGEYSTLTPVGLVRSIVRILNNAGSDLFFIQKSPEEEIFISEFGPTESEMKWTGKDFACDMTEEKAKSMRSYLLQFFPRCIIVEA